MKITSAQIDAMTDKQFEILLERLSAEEIKDILLNRLREAPKEEKQMLEASGTMTFHEQTKCGRCGHSWLSRTAKPVKCPKCKSPYWNKPRKHKIHRR